MWARLGGQKLSGIGTRDPRISVHYLTERAIENIDLYMLNFLPEYCMFKCFYYNSKIGLKPIFVRKSVPTEKTATALYRP